MNRDHSVVSEITSKYCISESFVDYDGYFFSSKGFWPTVVDIMVIWINLAIPVHFSSLILKLSMFSLAISCLTTSNLPWFVYLIFQVPVQYSSLQHQTLLPLPVTSTTGHFFFFGSASSFFLDLFHHSCPVAYWAPTYLGSSSFSVISFCLFIHEQYTRMLMWFPFPSPVDHVLSELSTMTRPSWVALHDMDQSFIELDKAVAHVIRLARFLWLWFQSVCPLMPSLSTYRLTWVSLTLGMGYLFTAAPAKRSRCSWSWGWA